MREGWHARDKDGGLWEARVKASPPTLWHLATVLESPVTEEIKVQLDLSYHQIKPPV